MLGTHLNRAPEKLPSTNTESPSPLLLSRPMDVPPFLPSTEQWHDNYLESTELTQAVYTLSLIPKKKN